MLHLSNPICMKRRYQEWAALLRIGYRSGNNDFPDCCLSWTIAGLISIIFPNGIWLISPVVISLLTGLFIRNTIQIAPKYKAGINYTVKTLLKVAIILLGIRFNFSTIAPVGICWIDTHIGVHCSSSTGYVSYG